MNYQNFLRTRRSIRRFKPDFVPMPVIERVLETATFAPSAHNLQPWRFAIIQTDSAKTALGKALTNKLRLDMNLERIPQVDIDSRIQRSLQRIGEAPLIILLCRDVTAVRKEAPEEHTMALQSVALAGLRWSAINARGARRRAWCKLDLLAFVCTRGCTRCNEFARCLGTSGNVFYRIRR